MKKEEINKIIAEFMAIDKGTYEILLPEQGWFDERTDRNSSKFRYHSNWNWLIPAWSKIITKIWDSKFSDSVELIVISRLENEFNLHVSRNAPLSASITVVQTIEWYQRITK